MVQDAPPVLVQYDRPAAAPDNWLSGNRALLLRLGVLGAGTLAVIMIVTLWNVFVSNAARQSTDDAYVQGDLTPLSARVGGYVRTVRVTDFQKVDKGDVLFEIEDQDYKAQLAQAEANVLAAQSAIENNRSQRDLQTATIASADAAVEATEADLTRYDIELKRQATLVPTGAASRQVYEQAEANQKRTRAQANQNRAQADAARRQLAVLDTQLKQLQAALMAQEAMRDLAQINLGYTKIIAPVSGMVGQRQVREGQYVATGAQLIALVPLDNLWVVANFKETQMTRMRPGQPVELTVDSFPGAVLKGKVSGWSPASGSQFSLLPPDNATGNFTKVVQRLPVRIDLDPDPNLAGLLRAGMSVVATVRVDRAP